jgi:hypothetical protein
LRDVEEGLFSHIYSTAELHKLTLRFGRGSCGLRSRFVRLAVAVRAICGCGSYDLWSRFVQFAVAFLAVCGVATEESRFTPKKC